MGRGSAIGAPDWPRLRLHQGNLFLNPRDQTRDLVDPCRIPSHGDLHGQHSAAARAQRQVPPTGRGLGEF